MSAKGMEKAQEYEARLAADAVERLMEPPAPPLPREPGDLRMGDLFEGGRVTKVTFTFDVSTKPVMRVECHNPDGCRVTYEMVDGGFPEEVRRELPNWDGRGDRYGEDVVARARRRR